MFMRVSAVGLILAAVVAHGAIVQIVHQEVQGNVLTIFGKSVKAFLGIPYAKPPVGPLRFSPPAPLDPWRGVYDATDNNASCIQFLPETYRSRSDSTITAGTQEDCLLLNVWTPDVSEENLKPVMVWIHGGGFGSGSVFNPKYEGSVLSALHDVVVVAMNFRLGTFGFLEAGVPDAPGNVAFLDQQMALKWVKKNIRAFGGDPSQVTLFGCSSGAMSINLHLISPNSKGLFKRAIMLSGTSYMTSLLDDPRRSFIKGNQIAVSVGCATPEKTLRSHTDEVLTCLRSKSAEEIVSSTLQLSGSKAYTFLPTFGNPFCPKDPILMMDRLQFEDVEVLTGTTSNEAGLFHESNTKNKQDPHLNGISTEDLYALANQVMKAFNVIVTNDTLMFYMKDIDRKNRDEFRNAIIDYLSDFYFNCPMKYFAERFTDKGNPLYVYRFSHRSMRSPFPDIAGVPHYSDVPYVFGRPLDYPSDYTDEDRTFSRELMHALTSFAKTGVPELPSGQPWPRFTRNDPAYVDLRPSNYTVLKGIRKKYCDFWTKYV